MEAPGDRRVMLEGARLGRRIGRTPPFSDLVSRETQPPPEVEGDDALLDYIRRAGTTVYHPCGTCRMGSDPAAVVDPRLRQDAVAGGGHGK